MRYWVRCWSLTPCLAFCSFFGLAHSCRLRHCTLPSSIARLTIDRWFGGACRVCVQLVISQLFLSGMVFWIFAECYKAFSCSFVESNSTEGESRLRASSVVWFLDVIMYVWTE